MGQQQSKQLNFEDVQVMIKNKNNIIINVLPENEQQCLIKNTLNVKLEVNTINELLKSKKSINIIVYGKNACDINVEKKQKQLKSGFNDIHYISSFQDYVSEKGSCPNMCGPGRGPAPCLAGPHMGLALPI